MADRGKKEGKMETQKHEHLENEGEKEEKMEIQKHEHLENLMNILRTKRAS